MKTRKFNGLLFGAAVALPIALILAAPFGALADPRGKDDAPHRGRARLFLVLRIADELELSDEKALAVSHALESAEARREELHKKRHELNDQLRTELDRSKPDEAKLSKLIDQSLELDRQRAQSLEESFNSLKKILTVPQQAKLVLLRARMYREVNPHDGEFHGGWRHRMDGPRGDRGPRGDDGPGRGGPPAPPPGGDGPADEG